MIYIYDNDKLQPYITEEIETKSIAYIESKNFTCSEFDKESIVKYFVYKQVALILTVTEGDTYDLLYKRYTQEYVKMFDRLTLESKSDLSVTIPLVIDVYEGLKDG